MKNNKAKIREEYFKETNVFSLDNLKAYAYWLEDVIVRQRELKKRCTHGFDPLDVVSYKGEAKCCYCKISLLEAKEKENIRMQKN